MNITIRKIVLLLSMFTAFGAIPGLAQENGQSLSNLLISFHDQDYYARLNAMAGLVKIGKTAVKPLIELLQDDDPAVRMYAAETLGKIGDVRAIRPLVALLKDKDTIVRIYAINALGDIKSESALKPLLKLINDEDPEVRKSLAESLGEIDNDLAIKPLIKLLEDANIRVRESAARALWEITKQNFGEDSIQWQEWFYKK